MKEQPCLVTCCGTEVKERVRPGFGESVISCECGLVWFVVATVIGAGE